MVYRPLEVGAGMLEVAVKEEAEHPNIDVVMVGGVSPGATRRIPLVEPPLTPAPPFHDHFSGRRHAFGHVQHERSSNV